MLQNVKAVKTLKLKGDVNEDNDNAVVEITIKASKMHK